jgi:isopentenyl-diphosphate delta-isomerase
MSATMKEELVILVNEKDEQVGLMPKMEAHEKALLHRAFSVFVFNQKNQLLLQQRAAHKYHSPLLWANTCCSHQRNGEGNIEAGRRRLMEEMGFVCDLKEVTSFIYKAPFDNGLTEHELDHIMIGHYNEDPVINEDEVARFKWMTLDEVKLDMQKSPELYTAWFKIIFEKYYAFINTKQ